jgi:hypothetical protein
MQASELNSYLRLAVSSLPDAAGTADQLSAVITLIQSAQAALRDGQPDSTSRVDAALTVALGTLALMCKRFESSASYLAARL